MDYSERITNLQALDFLTYKSYLDSPLWNLIRREILYRDEVSCKALRCPNRRKRVQVPKQVHHLSYSTPALLGIDPSQLVTLCGDCHERAEYSRRRKLSLEEARRKTLRMVGNFSPGVTATKILTWFKVRRTINRPTAQRILARLGRELPYWYEYILESLRRGRLSKDWIGYLYLEELV
jgi:5-methylcytosine-specific restriction endonuclease McrA